MPFSNELHNRFMKAIRVGFYLATIDTEHDKVHEGKSYTANYLEKSLATNGYARLLVRTGEKQAHVVIEAECEGKVYFRSFSNVTVSADGTAPGTATTDKLTLFNRCGLCTNGNTTQVFHTPTITNTGLMRGNRVFPFGQGGTAPGGRVSGRVESIFAPNSIYLIELQNVSGQSRDVGLILDWYEV